MRIESMVIGTDLSDASLAAARWAVRHVAPDARVVLTHVIELPHPPSLLQGLFTPTPELVENAREGAAIRLNAVDLDAAELRREIRAGRTADELIAVMAEEQADVLVVGRRGESRSSRSVGSTTEELAHTSRVPLLIAGAEPRGRPRHLLVAVEDSDASGYVLHWTRRLVHAFDARLTAVHVVSSIMYAPVSNITSPSDARRTEERLLEEGGRRLGATLGEAGVPADRVDAIVATGDPSGGLLAATERSGADMIIMGQRREGRLGRFLAGSVVGDVLRAAECPILVVPTD